MKEPSIKEKLEEARSLYKDANEAQRYVLEILFPELAESEDEKIRKVLIEYFNVYPKEYYGELKKSHILAWLEKQGEQKPPIIDFKAKNWYVSKVDGKIHDVAYNPTNKVEPKFKPGDWIVENTDSNLVFKVIRYVDNCHYAVVSEDSIEMRSALEAEKNYHLWSIQDAKDGDILCTYECDEPKIVFILKGTPKNVLCYHCYYNIMYPHFESDAEKGCLAPKDENVKPATKEQRDTLMKAIADAGFTFDFDKKELKEIKQNHTWSEEDEDMIQALNTCIDVVIKSGMNYISFDLKNILIGKVKNWLKSLKERVQHQNTWKPSDKQMNALDSTLQYSQVSHNSLEHLNSLFNDLKKLREE